MSAAQEEALKTLLLTLDMFSENQNGVTIGNSTVLDLGLAYAIVIQPGRVESGNAAGGTIDHTDEIQFGAFVKYVTDAEAYANMTTFTDAIVNLLDTHPTLGGMPNITLERLVGEEPLPVKDKADGGPYFLVRLFSLEISERVALSGGEY